METRFVCLYGRGEKVIFERAFCALESPQSDCEYLIVKYGPMALHDSVYCTIAEGSLHPHPNVQPIPTGAKCSEGPGWQRPTFPQTMYFPALRFTFGRLERERESTS
jgi:hypothetical protein